MVEGHQGAYYLAFIYIFFANYVNLFVCISVCLPASQTAKPIILKLSEIVGTVPATVDARPHLSPFEAPSIPFWGPIYPLLGNIIQSCSISFLAPSLNGEVSWYFKKLWMGYDKTRWMSWLGDNNKPSSGPDPDLAHQWDTKRKLFSLVEVCPLPSAVLVSSL